MECSGRGNCSAAAVAATATATCFCECFEDSGYASVGDLVLLATDCDLSVEVLRMAWLVVFLVSGTSFFFCAMNLGVLVKRRPDKVKRVALTMFCGMFSGLCYVILSSLKLYAARPKNIGISGYASVAFVVGNAFCWCCVLLFLTKLREIIQGQIGMNANSRLKIVLNPNVPVITAVCFAQAMVVVSILLIYFDKACGDILHSCVWFQTFFFMYGVATVLTCYAYYEATKTICSTIVQTAMQKTTRRLLLTLKVLRCMAIIPSIVGIIALIMDFVPKLARTGPYFWPALAVIECLSNVVVTAAFDVYTPQFMTLSKRVVFVEPLTEEKQKEQIQTR